MLYKQIVAFLKISHLNYHCYYDKFLRKINILNNKNQNFSNFKKLLKNLICNNNFNF